MTTLDDKAIWDDGKVSLTIKSVEHSQKGSGLFFDGLFVSLQPDISDEVLSMTTDEVISRSRLLENEIKVSRFNISYVSLYWERN